MRFSNLESEPFAGFRRRPGENVAFVYQTNRLERQKLGIAGSHTASEKGSFHRLTAEYWVTGIKGFQP